MDIQHETEPVDPVGELAGGVDPKTEVVGYVEFVEVGIHRGVYHIQSPDEDERHHGIVYVLPVGIADILDARKAILV
jgi:hypothetical protein